MKLDSSVTDPRTIKSFSTLAQRCKEAHGDSYIYSNVIFKSMNKDKVDILCTSCNTWFKQSMSEHLRPKGCPYCSTSNKTCSHSLNTEKFINKANRVHNFYYSYDTVNYTNNKIKVPILCPIHGYFEQRPDTHLRGIGCKHCALDNIVKPLQYCMEEIEEKANLIHGNKYSYNNSIYTGIVNSIEIECKEHGKFNQVVSDHLKGRGCPSCAISGFKTSLPGILYYLKVIINSQTLYKVGITNNTINKRFTYEDRKLITVLHQIHYKSGQDAYNEEQRILKQFKEFKYIGPDILKSGNTELFTVNVLNL